VVPACVPLPKKESWHAGKEKYSGHHGMKGVPVVVHITPRTLYGPGSALLEGELNTRDQHSWKKSSTNCQMGSALLEGDLDEGSALLEGELDEQRRHLILVLVRSSRTDMCSTWIKISSLPPRRSLHFEAGKGRELLQSGHEIPDLVVSLQ
jgi:hypothetical protein